MNIARSCRQSFSRDFSGKGFKARPLWARGGLILLAGSMMGVASADVFGDFTYEVNQATNPVSVTITDYPTAAIGAVEIPAEIDGKPVLAIGPQAFALCAGISSVTIPSSVTSIGSQAFLSCTALASVDIPSSVTSIENGAFNLCIVLTSVTIPSGVTVLSDSIFESCSGLTSVTIQGNVTSLGNSAFVGCGKLTSLVIPGTVTSIGTSAFRFCNGLTSMEIPSGVTALPFGIFSDCVNLTSVTLPSNLTSIGGSAFAKCSKLTSIATTGAATNPPSIVIPSMVASLGTFVFSECRALTSVVIPPGVPEIGTSAFELCTSLTTITIPPSVTSVGANAFRSCNSIVNIDFTSTTTLNLASYGVAGVPEDIVANIFSGCLSLESISVSPSVSNFSSAGGVLFSKSGFTLIAYPSGKLGPYTIPSTVTTVRSGAFRFAAGVTNISIPVSCVSTGIEAFAGCSSLTSFTVAAGNTAFKNGSGPLYFLNVDRLVAYPAGLTGHFSIPSTVTNFSTSAFRYCAGLTSVTLPSGVVNIRNTAFADCSQLTSATFEGNAPATVGTNVFQSAATGFTVYFNATAAGATFPIWKGYRSRVIGPNAALSNWLLDYNLPINSDLKSDANGDGVSLLMAYALNLNPAQNLSGSLPQPLMAADQMSLSFYAGAGGVTYVVEVSPDLAAWSTEGVSYSDLNQVRTATASRTPGSRFMRLSASY